MDAVSSSAVIAAGSALAGVFLAQAFSMLQAFFERKHHQKAVLRDKLEDLTQNLMQTVHWVDQCLQLHTTRGAKSGQSVQAPLRSSVEARRIYVLSLLYFPHLIDESQRVMKALNILYYAASGNRPDVDLVQAAEEFSAAKKTLEERIAAEAKKLL